MKKFAASLKRALQHEKLFPPLLGSPGKQQRPEVHLPSVMSTAQRNLLSQVYNETHGMLVQGRKTLLPEK